MFRDAEDAVYARDGYDYDGYRLRVEFPKGGGGSFRGGRSGGGRGPPARRSQYRVLVTGLPPTGSWQDLKDHMRDAGDVCYSDVFKDGSGVVEYLRREDMKYALKKLDDTKFKSHEVRFEGFGDLNIYFVLSSGRDLLRPSEGGRRRARLQKVENKVQERVEI